MVEIIKDTDTVKKLVANFEGVQDIGYDSNGIPMVLVPAEKIFDLAKFIKEEQKYDYFNCLTSAEDDNFYISIYTIYAMLDGSKRRITLKVNSPKDNPVVPSLYSIYRASDWFERESYDMMGIIYKDHPNLTRILTTDDWVGYPCRRDYKIVEPESYTSVLKAEPDEHVQKGIERSDIFKNLK
jgi:NADH:ubiquinone oxidoreductase subunit C